MGMDFKDLGPNGGSNICWIELNLLIWVHLLVILNLMG